MIVLCGIPSDPQLSNVFHRLKAMGHPVTIFNQRRVDEIDIEATICNGGAQGELRLADQRLNLQEVQSVYTRLMDYRALPEFNSLPLGAASAEHCARVHDVFGQWCEITSARVVNRVAPMMSNSSKPYQAQLIAAHGFAVPDTIITNEPEQALAFATTHGEVVYKSISGVRSVVQRLGSNDRDRLEYIRNCPVQFQESIQGREIRVHCVGKQLFATAVDSEAVDYRYARIQGAADARLSPTVLDATLSEMCIGLTAALGLLFAGIDLRLTSSDRAYCLEVNPCPGYSYYEAATGQPISAGLAHLLSD